MKATLKKTIKSNDKDWDLLQNSIQAALDQLGGYSPKNPTHWASPAPQSLWDAIDRLAAALRSTSGAPLP